MKAKNALCIIEVCLLTWPLLSCNIANSRSTVQSSNAITTLEHSAISSENKNVGITSSQTCSVPIIRAIELLDDRGNALGHADGWIKLTPQSKIRVRFEGKATKADFYTIPTGSQTYLLQQCIGSVHLTEKNSYAELNWKVPDSFMGYIFVLVYNGDVARNSDRFFIKAIR